MIADDRGGFVLDELRITTMMNSGRNEIEVGTVGIKMTIRFTPGRLTLL